MLALKCLDILELEHKLPGAKVVEDGAQEVVRAIIVEDQIANEYAGISPALRLCEIQFRV